MKVDSKFFDLLIELEGFKSCPYKDSINIPTIGIGTTTYPSGKKVTMKDKCITQEEAIEFAKDYIANTENVINLSELNVNQNQFNALVNFAYNIGNGAFLKSTLFKKVKINPNDSSIEGEFMKWVKAGGETSQGLINRRIKEAKLYFKK